jgi:hypothetical protein
MLGLDPASVLVFDEEVNGFNHGEHGASRGTSNLL